jgi:hypothetical protein
MCFVGGSRVLVPTFLEGKIDCLAMFWRARHIHSSEDRFVPFTVSLPLVVLDEYPC